MTLTNSVHIWHLFPIFRTNKLKNILYKYKSISFVTSIFELMNSFFNFSKINEEGNRNN